MQEVNTEINIDKHKYKSKCSSSINSSKRNLKIFGNFLLAKICL